MGGVISSFGSPVSTTCFTDDDAQPGRVRLAAVVIWRRPRPSTAKRPEDPPPPWQAPDGWSGAGGDDGREVLYHRKRRVVRVLEQEYPLPSTGEALLLLIDEPEPGVSLPAVGIHALGAAVHVRPRIDPTLDKPARLELINAAARAEHATWNEAITAHPSVRAFLASGSDDAAT